MKMSCFSLFLKQAIEWVILSFGRSFFLAQDFIECYGNLSLFQVRYKDKILCVVLLQSEPLILYIINSKRSDIIESMISFENISNLFHHINMMQVWNAVVPITYSALLMKIVNFYTTSPTPTWFCSVVTCTKLLMIKMIFCSPVSFSWFNKITYVSWRYFYIIAVTSAIITVMSVTLFFFFFFW